MFGGGADAKGALSAYGDALRDSVSITRPVNGSTMTAFSAKSVRAQVRGYKPNELGGLIMQGDMEVVMFKPDLDAAQFPLPKKGDKVLTADKRTLTVQQCDANTRRIGTTTIAYVCVARGS